MLLVLTRLPGKQLSVAGNPAKGKTLAAGGILDPCPPIDRETMQHRSESLVSIKIGVREEC